MAVLCNTTGTNPSRYAHEIADLVLGSRLKAPTVVRSVAVPPEVLERLAGVYRETSTDAVLRLVWDAKGGVVGAGGQPLVPTGPGELYTMDGARAVLDRAGLARHCRGRTRSWRHQRGTSRARWDLQAPFRPDAARLAEFAGDYTSTELGVTYTVLVEAGALQVRFRPAKRYALQPVFKDAFVGDGNTIRFTRSPGGAVDGLRIYAGRARHVRFARQPLTRSQ